MSIRNLINKLKGVSSEQEALLNLIEVYSSTQEKKRIKERIQQEEIIVKRKNLQVANKTYSYPEIPGEQQLNTQIQEFVYHETFSDYSTQVLENITDHIAPKILGMQMIKRAAAIQLFAKERMHVLLLGDPGTGKTDILTSAKALAPISSMGLGSGTTGAGLSVTYTKDGIQKGLLPLANNGVCCIDELNLMKKNDRAALYNAMEKGYITYDKAGKHEQFQADVRVLATANPKGDQFEGEDIQELKEQLPFEAALLSRFHIVFLIRKPDKKQFLEITRKIVSNQKIAKTNTEYIQAYITHAHKLTVTFPKHLEILVSEAAEKIKDAEQQLLIEVSPRIVNGIIGFSKASARMHLREKVNASDVRNVLEILSESLGLNL